MRIYLDTCCLNRPFDDQTIARNRIEAEAVLSVLDDVAAGTHVLVGSAAIDAEVHRTPDSNRQKHVLAFLSLQNERVSVTRTEEVRINEIVKLGIKPADALHVACAESGQCEVLLTTDALFLKRAKEHGNALRVRVENPATWALG